MFKRICTWFIGLVWIALHVMITTPPETFVENANKWVLILANEWNIPIWIYSPILYYINSPILRCVLLILFVAFLLHKFRSYILSYWSSTKEFFFRFTKFIKGKLNAHKPTFISFYDAVVEIDKRLDFSKIDAQYKVNAILDGHASNNRRILSLQKEVRTVLFLIAEEKLLSLYAHKVAEHEHCRITTRDNPLLVIPAELLQCDFEIYNSDNWSEDFKTFDYRNTRSQYRNVSIRREELDEFIKKHS